MQKFLAWIGVIIIIIVVIALYIYFDVTRKNQQSILTNKQEQEAIATLLGRAPQFGPHIVTGKTYIGKAVRFVYPSDAHLLLGHPSENVIDSVTWHTFQPYLLIAVTTSNASQLEQVSDDPSVAFRLQKSNVYSQHNITWNGRTGIEFTKNGNEVEQSAFFLIDGRTYSFVVTGDVGDSVTTAMENLISSASIVHSE